MIEISKRNRGAIEALPKDLQHVLQTDINEAIQNRVKVLKIEQKGRVLNVPMPTL